MVELKRPLATHPEPSATTVRDREAPGSNPGVRGFSPPGAATCRWVPPGLLHDLGEGPCGQNDEQAALRSEIALDGVPEPHRLPLSPLAPAPMNFSGFLFEACFAAGGAEVSRPCRYERSGTRRYESGPVRRWHGAG